MKVVSIDISGIEQLNAVATERWEAYRTAALRAQQSLAIHDGIAAGQAWRKFLDAFLSDPMRAMLQGAHPAGR